MNSREKTIELLKNYRSYKQAILNYERHKPSPSAGIANYSGMAGGSGAPERFFAEVGKRADMGLTSALDGYDHEFYRDIVTVIDFTVQEVLADDERYVIEMKWMARNPIEFYKIATLKHADVSTIRRWHREALRKLSISLAPIGHIPHIEEIKVERFMSG